VRLAVTGKGGAGKSVISATLARLYGRESGHVLAADLDVNPGMAISLGIPVTDRCLPSDAVQPAPPDIPYGFDIRSDLAPEEAVAAYAQHGPDGVSFMQIGNIGHVDHGLGQYVVAIRRILRGFRLPGWHVVADLEAGTTTPYEGYADFADRAAIVVEPGWVSALAARRLAAIFKETGPPAVMVGNKVRSAEDSRRLETLAEELDLPLAGIVPFDASILDADRQGLAPLDHAPSGAAVSGIRALAVTLNR
jgi:CO dehydrogenase maturation factor